MNDLKIKKELDLTVLDEAKDYHLICTRALMANLNGYCMSINPRTLILVPTATPWNKFSKLGDLDPDNRIIALEESIKDINEINMIERNKKYITDNAFEKIEPKYQKYINLFYKNNEKENVF